jgi:hypothetical protein
LVATSSSTTATMTLTEATAATTTGLWLIDKLLYQLVIMCVCVFIRLLDMNCLVFLLIMNCLVN